MEINEGSFRDPCGRVFTDSNKIYRSIFSPGLEDFKVASEAGIYRVLVKEGFLLKHEKVECEEIAPKGTVCLLEHPVLPMVSYPWEWPFSMLKDAALVHLKIMEKILPKGFWLRDASAFNVQYDGRKLCFIDTLSIGRRIPESPWTAYKQFCSHFLAPLAMAAYCDIRMLDLWRSYIDGFPLDLAVKILPFLKRFRPGLFMHLTLHSRYQEKSDQKEDIGKQERAQKPKITDQALLNIIRSLKKTIQGIQWEPSSAIWDEYANIRTYEEKDVSAKSEYVDKVVQRLNPGMVWDLGANTGEFSIIAARHGAFVVSIEGDPACSEHLYRNSDRNNGTNRILPLTMDLANPSPALGWDNTERMRLKDRGPADLVMALALIHHLVFSACIPLDRIARWLHTLSEHVLVEFIPPEDPMVKQLLSRRNGDHHSYNLDTFLSVFEKHFKFEDHYTLENGRILYLLSGLSTG